MSKEQPINVAEYGSIRVKASTHARGGVAGGNISAGGPRRIYFRVVPFEHFVVIEQDKILAEIPIENVASAIPKGTTLLKFRRTPDKEPPSAA